LISIFIIVALILLIAIFLLVSLFVTIFLGFAFLLVIVLLLVHGDGAVTPVWWNVLAFLRVVEVGDGSLQQQLELKCDLLTSSSALK